MYKSDNLEPCWWLLTDQ